MHHVLRELKKRGVSLKELDALEVFGGSGELHTKDYASQVATLEVWEIDAEWEKSLRRNLPMAEVKITDSFKELTKTPKKYSFIVVDDSPRIYYDYCEHFDLFPDVFRILKDSAIIILNVVPEINATYMKQYGRFYNETHVARRKSFYQTDHPGKVPLDKMVEVYKNLCMQNGFNLEWYFFRRRSFIYSAVYYLVLKIKKSDV